MNKDSNLSKTRSEWGDSLSLSKNTKAMKSRILESHPVKKAEITPAYQNTRPLTQQLDPAAIKELREQWSELTTELTKATGSIAQGIDHVAAKTIEGSANVFVILTNSILKAILFPFKVIKELIAPSPAPKRKYTPPKPRVQRPEKFTSAELSEEDYYTDDIPLVTIGGLSKKGVTFYTIKNELISNLLKEERCLTMAEENAILDASVEEIKRCAKMSGGLPNPTSGKFVNIPMPQILEAATKEYLQQFLIYVEKHPNPFLGKTIKLAEAYATWAYKGTPID